MARRARGHWPTPPALAAGRSPVHRGADPTTLHLLSQTGGNAAAARMMRRSRPADPEAAGVREEPLPFVPGPSTETRSYTLATTIAWDPHATPVGSPAAVAAALADAPRGQEEGVDESALEKLTLDPPMPSGATPETANPGAPPAAEAAFAGQEGPESEEASERSATPESAAQDPRADSSAPAAPVSLPDIRIDGLEDLHMTDSVSSWLGYEGSISRGGIAVGGNFGITGFGDVRVTDITVLPVPWLGVFVVRANIVHAIRWDVRSRVGPGGEVDVDWFFGSALTGANYEDAADDLTPDMGDLNGRPPRDAFWAEDLTERHERFHAEDAKANGPAAVGVGSAWLSAQAAADVPGVHALLASVPGRVVTALIAAMAFPDVEERAYGDGAGAYRRRAMAIRAAGAAGLYT